MDNLIAKLETASEGTRELDKQITAVVNPSEADELRFAGITPNYSRSVDAAITLIPRGMWYRIEHFSGGLGSGKEAYSCNLTHVDVAIDSGGLFGVSFTAPLAICIASLKAINKIEKEKSRVHRTGQA